MKTKAEQEECGTKVWTSIGEKKLISGKLINEVAMVNQANISGDILARAKLMPSCQRMKTVPLYDRVQLLPARIEIEEL